MSRFDKVIAEQRQVRQMLFFIIERSGMIMHSLEVIYGIR